MRIVNSKGFTLVELIATLIIIALIAAVGGPRFFSINTFRESGFYDETISSVRYAQKYAVASGCNVEVRIAANGFTLYRPNTAGNCTAAPPYTIALADPSGNATSFTRTAPSGVTLTPATFTFSALGVASVSPDPLSISVGGRQFLVHGETGFVQRQ
jgi:MSHA pilin protein MshC